MLDEFDTLTYDFIKENHCHLQPFGLNNVFIFGKADVNIRKKKISSSIRKWWVMIRLLSLREALGILNNLESEYDNLELTILGHASKSKKLINKICEIAPRVHNHFHLSVETLSFKQMSKIVTSYAHVKSIHLSLDQKIDTPINFKISKKVRFEWVTLEIHSNLTNTPDHSVFVNRLKTNSRFSNAQKCHVSVL